MLAASACGDSCLDAICIANAEISIIEAMFSMDLADKASGSLMKKSDSFISSVFQSFALHCNAHSITISQARSAACLLDASLKVSPLY